MSRACWERGNLSSIVAPVPCFIAYVGSNVGADSLELFPAWFGFICLILDSCLFCQSCMRHNLNRSPHCSCSLMSCHLMAKYNQLQVESLFKPERLFFSFYSQTAGLHPTAEQIEMFAYHLPDATLSNLIVRIRKTYQFVFFHA